MSVAVKAPPLSRRLAAALDPVVYAEQAGYRLDAWQAMVCRSKAPRIILNCSRQSGKSFCTAVLALHTALFAPRSEVVVVSSTQRQAALLLRKCVQIFDRNQAGRSATSQSVLTVEFDNGSRIIALPGKESTVRGYSVALLIVDEAAQVPDGVYDALGPTLARTNGRQVVLSTPHGTRGFFYDVWSSQERLAEVERAWLMVRITAEQSPHISAERLAEEREAHGDWWFAQEFMCTFMDAQTAAFRASDIAAAVVPIDTWDELGFVGA